MPLFGAKKKAPDAKDAITKLRETLDMLDKREKFLQTKADKEIVRRCSLSSSSFSVSSRLRYSTFYVFFSIFFTSVVGFLVSFSRAKDNESTLCRSVIGVVAFLNVASCALTLWLRPFIVPLRSVLMCVIEVATAITSIWVFVLTDETASATAASDESFSRSIAAIQLITIVGSMVPCLVLLLSKIIRIVYLCIANCQIISAYDYWSKFDRRSSNRSNELVENLLGPSNSNSPFPGGANNNNNGASRSPRVISRRVVRRVIVRNRNSNNDNRANDAATAALPQQRSDLELR
jgi:hypothetical protein